MAKYRRYDHPKAHVRIPDNQRPELDPITYTPDKQPIYTVTCIRKGGTTGRLVVNVAAPDEEAAKELARRNLLAPIGGGWEPIRAIRLEEDAESLPTDPRFE